MEARIGRLDDLAVGHLRKVEVGDKAVLMVRRSDGLRAFPAECPHYQGPLPDGVVHHGRLVCPWHHATFSTDDGDLLEPPSFAALQSYPVSVEEHGEVIVTLPDEGRGTRTPLMAAADPERPAGTALLIGAGAAGAAAAESLRQNGFTGRVTMLSTEDRPPYDRPNCSKDLLAGTMKAAWMPLRSPAFYEKHGIERVTGRVVRFDAASRTAVLEDGRELTGDAVLLAPGAEPRRLPAPNTDLPGIFTLRSWDDSETLAAAAEETTNAVVIGASFIGLEVAASLRARDLPVTVVAPDRAPLAAVFGGDIGDAVRRLHEEHGVVFRLEHGVEAFDGDGHVRAVVLDTGESLPADLVVTGVGAAPATGFIEGIERDRDRGIAVTADLLAAPRVWAAGDVARYPAAHIGEDVRIEHWRLALQHGRAAGRSMSGQPQPFTGVPFFWSKHYKKSLRFAGYGGNWDQIVVAGDVTGFDFVAYFIRDRRLRAACGTRNRQVAAFAELMRTGDLPDAAVLRERPETDLTKLLTAE